MGIFEILSIIVVGFFVSILSDKRMIITRKTMLYSFPASMLMAIDINADLLLKYGFKYNGIQQLEVLLILIGLGMCFVGIPIYLALSSEDKYKKWIIWLAALCFLPFGTILYFISLIWAIIVKIKQIKNTKKSNQKVKNMKKINWKKYINKQKLIYVVVIMFCLLGVFLFYLHVQNQEIIKCKKAQLIKKTSISMMQTLGKEKSEDVLKSFNISQCMIWSIYTFSDKEIHDIIKNPKNFNLYAPVKTYQCLEVLEGNDQKAKDDISKKINEAIDLKCKRVNNIN